MSAIYNNYIKPYLYKKPEEIKPEEIKPEESDSDSDKGFEILDRDKCLHDYYESEGTREEMEPTAIKVDRFAKMESIAIKVDPFAKDEKMMMPEMKSAPLPEKKLELPVLDKSKSNPLVAPEEDIGLGSKDGSDQLFYDLLYIFDYIGKNS